MNRIQNQGRGRRRRGRTQLPLLPQLLLLPLLLLLVVAVAAANENTDPFEEDDDDDLAASLRLLYQHPDDRLDPHNMLALPGDKWHSTSPTIVPHGDEGGRTECEGKDVSEKLKDCLSRLHHVQNSLQKEQSTSLGLHKMLAKEGVMDLKAFYRRAVQHLWNVLRLEDVGEVLKDGNTALVREVMVRISQQDFEGLSNYLNTEMDPHKVDEFLQQGFILKDLPQDSTPSLLHSFTLLITATLQAGKSLEVWLCVLCVGFVCLAAWAVVLFIRDVQKELRWGCVVGMMATVVFFICCVWHWRHMYKMAESRRHAQLAKRGYAGIPEECQPGATASSATLYQWITVNLFGSPDVCEKYFEELMIDAIEEITPGMVIAETVSKFLFQPLQHLGTESGKLTTNFYKNVPPAYHLHATALFLGLLVVVLFYGCAYGIDFPLGLGGYRPMARQHSSTSSTSTDRAAIQQEAVRQMNKERERFLEESRRMLSDISKAVQETKGRQQVVVASSGILEAQLERLISRHLDRAMEQGTAATISTITSTPLRTGRQGVEIQRQGVETGRESLQGVETERQGVEAGRQGVGGRESSDLSSRSMLGDLSSSSEDCDPSSRSQVVLDDHEDPSALLVSTDAVHRRVAGTAAVPCLPPRSSSRSCSRSSSTVSSPAASEIGSPAVRRQKGSRLMRLFRSAGSEEAPPSPPPSPSSSLHSLSLCAVDEPDLAVPPNSESFLAEVRNVLDVSVNSTSTSPPRHALTDS